MGERFNYNHLATIKRITNSGVGVGSKGTYSTVGTCYGYLHTIDQDQNSLGNMVMAQAQQFEVSADVDIRASDRLVINNVEYPVRGVQLNDFKRNSSITCSLEKPLRAN